jgi:RNA-directed DNA polymerase
VTLAEFERDLPAHLSALRHMLMKGRYQPGPPGIFTLQKRTGGTRQIAVLNVVDRVAQRAAQQVIEPLYEPVFLPCNFGFRPGRSTLDAIVCARRLRASGYRWVVDGDIAACFDSLDHQLLVRRMEKRIGDSRVLDLLQKWLNVGMLEHGIPPGGTGAEKTGWLSQGWEMNSNRLKQGFDWALNTIARGQFDQGQYGPYSEARYKRPAYTPVSTPVDASYPEAMGEDDAGLVMDDDDGAISTLALRQAEEEELERRALQQRAVQQVAAGGLLLGTGWTKRSLVRAGRAAITALKTPAGREILKKGLLAGGGAVGAAAGLAVTAYLLYRNVAPAQVGVLQGSPLSPLLANIYLHPFDVSITRGGFRLVRFADDWVILCPEQVAAEKAYNESIAALAHIRLKVNPDKTRILSPADRLEWLGYVVE